MFNLNDRVKETTSTAGDGNISLGGAASGFQSFTGGIGSGNTCHYTIVHQEINTYEEWEVGFGTVSGANLIRNQVYQSSNNNALVNFSAGVKDAFCTYPATGSVYYESGDFVPIRTGSAPEDTSNRLYNVGGTLFWDSVDVTGGGGGGSTYYAGTGLTLVDGTGFNTSGTGYFDELGIGTYPPTYTLDVAGNAGFDEYLYHNGDDNTSIRFTDDRIRFTVGGLNLLGLHKKGSAPHQVTINHEASNADFVINDNSSDVYFRADASKGQIGIGSGTADYTLDVHGTGNFRGGVRYPDGQVQIVAYTGCTGVPGGGSAYYAGTGLSFDPATTFNIHIADTGGAYPTGIVKLQDSGSDGYVAGIAVTPNALYDVSGNLQTSIDALAPAPADGPYITWEASDDLSDERTLTATSGLSSSKSSTVFNIGHASTGASTSNNSGRTYIQDITLDAYGHVHGIETATETTVNTWRPAYTAGTGLLLDGQEFNNYLATTGQSGITELLDAVTNGVTTKAVTPNAVYDWGTSSFDKYNYWTVGAGGDNQAVSSLENLQFSGSGGIEVAVEAGPPHKVVISGSGMEYNAGNGLLLGGSTFTLDDPANGTTINEGTIVDADRMLIWDEDASSWKYVTIEDLEDEIGGGGGGSYSHWFVSGVDIDEPSVPASGQVDTTDYVVFTGQGTTSVSLSGADFQTVVISGAPDATKMSNFTLSDGSNTQTIEDGNTLKVTGTAYGVESVVSATDTVTLDLPTKVNIDASFAVSGTGDSINLNETNVHSVLLTGSPVALGITGPSNGQRFLVRLLQDGTGDRTVTWFDTVCWPNDAVPTLTPDANRVDVFGFLVVDASGPTFEGFTIGKNLSC